MKRLVPQWSAVLFTRIGMQARIETTFEELANLLLYSDVVSWMPFELMEADSVVASKASEYDRRMRAEQVRSLHLNTIRAVESAGLSGVFRNIYQPSAEITKYTNRMQVVRMLRDFADAVESCSVLVSMGGPSPDPQPPLPGVQPVEYMPRDDRWDPYQAVQVLSASVSRLLLPDVGQLPIDAIAELRDKLNPILNPMRAEMLRLTEGLRNMVTDTVDRTVLSTEADILIATRVEPLIREAGQKTEEMMKKKWRKLLQGGMTVFGLTGAAFLRPDLLKDVVKEGVETAAALVEREAYGEPLADTARFVLEARRFMIGA